MTKSKTHPALTAAAALYDKIDPETGEQADLSPHEQTFLTAVHRITMAAVRTKSAAQLDFGYGSKTYLATAFTAEAKENEDLTAALELFNATHAEILEGIR